MTSSHLKAQSPNIIAVGITASIYGFWWDTTIQFINRVENRVIVCLNRMEMNKFTYLNREKQTPYEGNYLSLYVYSSAFCKSL